MKKDNVSELVELSKKGDDTAFELLFTSFKSRLHNSLFKILRNFHETEDIVQQAFIRAWEKIDTFKGDSHFFTWLYRIGFNLAISKINRNKDVRINTGKYKGGGTAFHNYGEVPPLPTGHALMFPSFNNLHKGLPVESGDRYLLVFWLCDRQKTIDLYHSLD